MANESLQLNLGSLRSAMALTLHTHHASRIWHGRAASEGKPGIIGLNAFLSIMNKLKRGAEQDDPYSDWWMLRVEEKINDTRTRLQALREQVDQALADVPRPSAWGTTSRPAHQAAPVRQCQLGFMAVYLLADYDELARRLILAHHTALIDRSTLERWLNDGAHALRSLFSLAQQYRYSGTCRDDFAANNAVARTHGTSLETCPRTYSKAPAVRASRRRSTADRREIPRPSQHLPVMRQPTRPGMTTKLTTAYRQTRRRQHD
ncbi:TIGR03761 family integrating conjugative element protein [Halopseudomonas pachastrellae]|nr:TIGR03761 family integrating conjugative element protein [Halopseudomonas pachastrellae]